MAYYLVGLSARNTPDVKVKRILANSSHEAVTQYINGLSNDERQSLGDMWKPQVMKMPDPDTMSHDEKVERYRAGKFQFPVPPVTTGRWGEEEWIAYIDLSGVWLW